MANRGQSSSTELNAIIRDKSFLSAFSSLNRPFFRIERPFASDTRLHDIKGIQSINLSPSQSSRTGLSNTRTTYWSNLKPIKENLQTGNCRIETSKRRENHRDIPDSAGLQVVAFDAMTFLTSLQLGSQHDEKSVLSGIHRHLSIAAASLEGILGPRFKTRAT